MVSYCSRIFYLPHPGPLQRRGSIKEVKVLSFGEDYLQIIILSGDHEGYAV